MNTLRNHIAHLGPIVLFALGVGVWGLNWGVPSRERLDFFLEPGLRTTQFYSELEKVRSDRYEMIGQNPAAYAGRMFKEGRAFIPPSDIRNVFSSFILRSHDADEQSSLVMVSRLNPLKGRWYPNAYYYGGGYVYPLACFLGAAHVIGIIHLVPSVAYYYERPEEMGRIFLMLRLWSVLGFVFGACGLYLLIRTLSGPRIALWSSLFFILTPACMGFSKIGKPHIWSPGWTFLMLLFCFRFKKSGSLRDLIFLGVFAGCALGTATNQSIFLLFVLWAIGSISPRDFIMRICTVFGIGAAVFLALNPYFPFHLQDFQYELELVSRWYPFKIRPAAVPDFFYFILRPALGNVLFVLGSAGFLALFFNQRRPVPQSWLVVLLGCLVLLSFQLQVLSRDPLQIRPCLAVLGLFSFFAAWISFQISWGIGLRWACAIFMAVFALIYARHFRSDRIPYDNASSASLWIQKNVPKNSVIHITYNIPTVDQFPPVNFNDYKFAQIDSSSAAPVGSLVILNPRGPKDREDLLKAGYQLEQRFENSPLQRWGLVDCFTNANFPVLIFKKR